jgi:L-ascorbate metabolism protein UlaG (beta-lactamase superfamily)
MIGMIGITWLGHGTFELTLGTGEVYVLDPWTNGNPAYPKGHKFSRIDYIVISHGHYDHIHDAVPLAKKFDATCIGIFETCKWLEKQGAKNSPMNKGGTQQAGPAKLTMTHAIHSCGIIDGEEIIYGGEAAGYVIELPDTRRIYFAGDTNVFSDMAIIHELYQPKLAMLPIGDLFTMGPREAALACQLLKAELVIPMHFGTFPPLTGRPEQLQELLVNSPETRVWALEPGKRVDW